MFCSLSQRESIQSLPIKCDMYNRFCLFVLGSNQVRLMTGSGPDHTQTSAAHPLGSWPLEIEAAWRKL